MAKLTLAVRRFFRDEEGAALAEYGILVAFIAVVSIGIIVIFGKQISDKFTAVSSSLS